MGYFFSGFLCCLTNNNQEISGMTEQEFTALLWDAANPMTTRAEFLVGFRELMNAA
jgi:hypothetical protein